MQTEQNIPSKFDDGGEPKQETIKELADRHLADENHTTTDEELRNARIVLDVSVEAADEENLYEIDNSTVLPELPGEESDELTRKDESSDSDDNDGRNNHFPNPYDVLK